MKSKKIIAMVLAFASLMAIATSGLAAAEISTITTYNTGTNKVAIETSVSGLAEQTKEVTYVVTSDSAAPNADNILYIDQQSAVDNAVKFTYKIDKDKMPANLTPVVKLGNDGGETLTAKANEVVFNNVTATGDDGVAKLELSYSKTAGDDEKTSAWFGTQDTLYLHITTKDNYKVANVTGATKDGVTDVYTVTDNTVTVTTESTVVTPVITPTAPADGDVESIDMGEGKTPEKGVAKTVVLSVTDNKDTSITEIGVIYMGIAFKALKNALGEALTDALAAVRILVPDSMKNLDGADVAPYAYYMKDGKYFKAEDHTEIK